MSLLRRKRKAVDGYSVVDEHLSIRGELDTEGTVRIDGRVEGRLHRIGTLIIGVKGVVVGDVEANDIVVAGSIVGHVQVANKVEVQATARLRGDLSAGTMLLHEGGKIQGTLTVGKVEEVPAQVETSKGAPALKAG